MDPKVCRQNKHIGSDINELFQELKEFAKVKKLTKEKLKKINKNGKKEE